MNVKRNLICATVLAFAAASAHAAGGGGEVEDHAFSFEGPFGQFDQSQLQRGWQVYSEVCSACHGLKYLYYRNLAEHGGPMFSEEQAKAIAAGFTTVDGPDSDGEMFDRPAILSDHMVSPFPNDAAAAVANGGAVPPDLSLITKSRAGFHGILNQILSGSGGPEYVRALLLGYDEAPADVDVGDLYYNPVYASGALAMAPPLLDDIVEYQDGTPATTEQMASDVSAFLAWAAEPKMADRKLAGIRNVVILLVLAGLLYASTHKLWKPIKRAAEE